MALNNNYVTMATIEWHQAACIVYCHI